MPDNNEQNDTEGEIVNNDDSQQPDSQMSEAFQASLIKVFGEHEPYKPTKKQVDKLLELQERGMEFTHKERTMFQPQRVLELIAFLLLLIFIGAILWLILAKAPDYTGEAVSSAIGLIGGGGIGYGFGINRKGTSDE